MATEQLNKHYLAGEQVAEYVRAATVREPETLRRLREETARHPRAIMQISPEQGQFFQLLVRLTGAKKALEIGVFTGYSSLAVALAMPPEGRLTACDVSEEYTAIARRYWSEAGVSGKIDLRIGPAVETLRALLAEGAANSYDFIFIDADKPSYGEYYELSLQLVRPGGLIALDNMLYHGLVPDPDEKDGNAVILRALNAKIASDGRVTASLLPLADGVYLAVKN